jgi:hypothetical protein
MNRSPQIGAAAGQLSTAPSAARLSSRVRADGKRLPRWILPTLDFTGAWAALTAVLLSAGFPFAAGTVLPAFILVAFNWAASLYPTGAAASGESLDPRRTAVLICTTALFSWSAWMLSGSLLGSGNLGQIEGLAAWVWTFGACLLNRRIWGHLAESSVPAERWLVVGDIDTAARLDAIVARQGAAQVVGAVPLPAQGTGMLGIRAEALGLVEKYRADRVIVAPRVAERETTLSLISTFKSIGVATSLLPEPVELAGTGALTSREIAGVPVIDVGPLEGGQATSAVGPAIGSANGAEDGPSSRNGSSNGIWPRVSVVVPAMNEARNLPHVFGRLPDGLHEVILVDGNSTDDTAAVARRVRPDVRVLEQPGRGKGDALRTGFAAVTGDIIVTLDADGSADPAEIPSFVEHLRAGADFAKGSRFVRDGGSADITPFRRLGNWGLNTTVNVLYGSRYTDLCYGYNAFWTSCLPCISLDVAGFEVETLMNLRVISAGLKVSEVPSFEAERIHGHSNLNAVRDGSRVLRTIVKERVRTQGAAPQISRQGS